MTDRLATSHELGRGFFPRSLEASWSAIWENFRLLAGADATGFEEVTVTPTAGSNTVPHKLGRTPRRWSIVRALQVTGAVYETAATDTALTLYVVSVGASPELIVRVW